MHMAPAMAIVGGAVIVWYMGLRLDPDKQMTHVEWGLRLFGIITGLIFWAIITSWVQKKEMYGGGLVDMCADQERRLQVWRTLYFVFWALAAIALSTKDYRVFWVIGTALFMSIVSEIGWRRPLIVHG